MKKILTILAMLLLPSAVATMAQSTDEPMKQKEEKVLYKGQIHISQVKVFKEADRIHLQMRVTYSTDLLNRGEKLYVSPQFRKGTDKLNLASMVFDGKSRKWRIRGTDVIVVADEANGHYHFDIDYSGRYSDWLQGSDLCFQSEEVTDNNVKNYYTDCLFTDIVVPERLTADQDIPYLTAITAMPVEQPITEQVTKNREARKVGKQAVKQKLAKAKSEPVTGGRFHLRTNLLYDAVLLPNVGLEYGVSPKVSLVLNAGGNWLKNDSKHWYWRVLMADIEGRYWLGSRPGYMGFRHQGHHVGIYGAVYRYDIEFGHKGQMGDFAYGGGVSYGYSLPIGRKLSLDLALGLGYIGGKYKEYEPQDDCYVWLADKQRHYFGPTKAEVTLIWHLGK